MVGFYRNSNAKGMVRELLRERFEVAATDAAIGHHVPAFLAARLDAGPERSFDRTFNPFGLLGSAVVVIDEESLLHFAAALRASGSRHGGPMIRPDFWWRQTTRARRIGTTRNTSQPSKTTPGRSPLFDRHLGKPATSVRTL